MARGNRIHRVGEKSVNVEANDDIDVMSECILATKGACKGMTKIHRLASEVRKGGRGKTRSDKTGGTPTNINRRTVGEMKECFPR
jgi:hypothetical protein